MFQLVLRAKIVGGQMDQLHMHHILLSIMLAVVGLAKKSPFPSSGFCLDGRPCRSETAS